MRDDGRERARDAARAETWTNGRAHALKLVVLLSAFMVTGALLTSSIVADPQARSLEDEAEEIPEYVPSLDSGGEIIDVSRLPRFRDEMTVAPAASATFRGLRIRERR